MSFLLVFFGAGLGGSARHGVNLACLRWCGTAWPYGTLFVNVVGSTAMGLLAGFFAFRADVPWSQPARLFTMTGVLGGFTTFSAFSLETVLLWERGEPLAALTYVVASVLLAVGGLVGGLTLMRSLT